MPDPSKPYLGIPSASLDVLLEMLNRTFPPHPTAGGARPLPSWLNPTQEQRYIDPVGAIQGITDVVDLPKAGGALGAAYFLPGFPKPQRHLPDVEDDVAVALERALRERGAESLETPEALAGAIAEARGARESATGSRSLGMQVPTMPIEPGEIPAAYPVMRGMGEPARPASVPMAELYEFGQQASKQGIRQAPEQRIVEDVLLDSLEDQLAAGELPRVGAISREEVFHALPRERNLPQSQDVYRNLEESRARAARGEGIEARRAARSQAAEPVPANPRPVRNRWNVVQLEGDDITRVFRDYGSRDEAIMAMAELRRRGITPDIVTPTGRLGSWTEADFEAAARRRRSPRASRETED